MKLKGKEDFTPVALYARVSSERQDVDLSVAAQLRALRDHAKKNNFLVVREYVDEAESGRVANRPQFSRMIEEARKPEAPFKEILVWKFSRFTRKREHAVAFKSMLRRRGIRVTSITEHADDSPTGKLMEAIIESVDEFYSENLALEVIRGMREAASRGFWVTARPPFGYTKVYVQDGVKKRPKLEIDKEKAPVVRRMFDMALEGKSSLDITKALNGDGIPSPTGKRWHKNSVHSVLNNEVYTGTLVWGINARDGVPPVRVNRAFPSLVTKRNYRQVGALLRSRAPRIEHPRRSSSPYLLSGLARCERCRKALTASEAKGGKYTYYVCRSLLMQGRRTCQTPRLNAKHFEGLIVKNIRENILTESNIRDLVKIVDEEMDGEARDQRKRLKTIRKELDEVKERLGRIWQVVETTKLDIADAADRIRELRERKEKLEAAEDEARTILKRRRVTLDRMETIAAFARDMSEYLRTSELTGTRAFIRSFVKEIQVKPGKATIRYTIPTPEDSPIGGGDIDEVTLGEGVVMSSAHYGGPDWTKSRTGADSWLIPPLGMGIV